MKCLSCKYGNMIDSTTTYVSVLEKIDELIAMTEKLASEVSIIDYSKVA